MLALRASALWLLWIPLSACGQSSLRLLPAQGGTMTTVTVEDIEDKRSIKAPLPKPSSDRRPGQTIVTLKTPPQDKTVADQSPPKKLTPPAAAKTTLTLGPQIALPAEPQTPSSVDPSTSEQRSKFELKPMLELMPANLPDLEDGRARQAPPTSSSPLSGRSLMSVQVEDISELTPPKTTPRPEWIPTPAPKTSLLKATPAPIQPRLSDAARRQQATAKQLARLRAPMSSLRISGLAATTDTPPDQAMGMRVSQQGFTSLLVAGEYFGPDIPRTSTPYLRRHLYFEDAALERCGESGGIISPGWWTNPCSFTKFTLDTLRFPFQVLIDRPDELVVRQAK